MNAKSKLSFAAGKDIAGKTGRGRYCQDAPSSDRRSYRFR